MPTLLVFYRDLHAKAAGLLRESALGPGPVFVDGLGVQEKMEPCLVQRPGGTDGYLLMCFHDAALVGDRSGTAWRPPGSLILWRPGEPHLYGNEGQTWNHSWIHLCGEDVPMMLRRIPIPLNEALPFAFADLLDEGLTAVYEELEGVWPADGDLVRNLLECLFRRVRRALRDDPLRSPVPERLLAVKRYLDAHYNEPFSLETLAHVGRMSVSHLSARFRECFGCAPIEFRTRLRMEHAARFLRDTSLRVSEVAMLVGYSDVYYFSRHFKTHHGLCPRLFRRQSTRPRPI